MHRQPPNRAIRIARHLKATQFLLPKQGQPPPSPMNEKEKKRSVVSPSADPHRRDSASGPQRLARVRARGDAYHAGPDGDAVGAARASADTEVRIR